MFRIVGDADDVLAAVKALEPLVSVEEVLRVPPVRLHTIPGFPSRSFPFTTDIPLLDRWGVPLLFGPGSFLRRPYGRRAAVDRRVRSGDRVLRRHRHRAVSCAVATNFLLGSLSDVAVTESAWRGRCLA